MHQTSPLVWIFSVRLGMSPWLFVVCFLLADSAPGLWCQRLRPLLVSASLSDPPVPSLPVLVLIPHLSPKYLTGQWGHLFLPLTRWTHDVGLMTRMLCDLLIIGQITKAKTSHLNVFPSLSFSFPSLPSSPSPFSPFLLARGRACEPRELGSHPVSASPSLLPTLRAGDEEKHWAGRPLSPGPRVLTLSHLQSTESPRLLHPREKQLEFTYPVLLRASWSPMCAPDSSH